MQVTADEDTQWFDEILRQMWPRICVFIGNQLKASLVQMALKLNNIWTTHLFTDVDRFVSRLQSHPITFPVRKSWLNAILADAWSFMQPVVHKAVQEYMAPMIKGMLPKKLNGIDVQANSIGQMPPVIRKMQTDRRSMCTSGGKKEFLHMLIDIEWRSDMDISLSGAFGLIDVGLKRVDFAGRLHVCLMEIMDKPPFVGGFSMYMANPPQLNFEWSGIVDIFDNSTIEGLIHKQVTSIIANKVVLPHRIGFAISDDCDVLRCTCPRPRGLLKVTLQRATGLRNDDFNFSTLWTGKRSCDPYCVAELGATRWQSTTVKGVVEEVAGLGAIAVWGESYYFLVDEPFDQLLAFTVFDRDLFCGDEPLSRVGSLSVFDLLGLKGHEGPEALKREISHQSRICMENLWAAKASENTYKPPTTTVRQSFQEMDEKEKANGSKGAADKRSARSSWSARVMKAATEASHDIVNEVKTIMSDARGEMEKTLYGLVNNYDELVSELELSVIWRPLELNSAVAQRIVPGMSSEKVTACLFVGIYGAFDLPLGHGTNKATTYWAQVECLPMVHPAGKNFTASAAETKQRTVALSIPPMNPRAQSKHKEETELARKRNLQKKIVLLISNNMPIDVIAQVLDMTALEVAKYLANAVTHEMLDEASIEWNEGFSFLLSDPRAAQVSVEIFANKDESLGRLVYQVGQLLGKPDLTDPQMNQSLVVGPKGKAGAKVSCRFQLRTVHMGNTYPLGDPRQKTEDRGLNFSLPTKRRTVFVDKTGRQKVQIDGFWVDEESSGVVDRIIGAGEKVVKGVVEGVEASGLKVATKVLAAAAVVHDAILGAKEDTRGRLYVSIFGAKSLPSMDGPLAGVSNPYCVCKLAKKGVHVPQIRSMTIKNSLEPEWNFSGELPGFDPGDSVTFEVWDQDIAKSDALLGAVTLPSNSFYPAGFAGVLCLIDLQSGQARGTIKVRVNVPMNISISIVRARELPNRDGILAGVSDPYCVCEILGKETVSLRTKVIWNNLDPQWDFSGELHIFTPGDCLRFQVWDSDTPPKPDQLLGTVLVGAHSFEKNGFEGDLAIDGFDGKHAGMLQLRIGVPKLQLAEGLLVQRVEGAAPAAQTKREEPLPEPPVGAGSNHASDS